MKNGVFWHVEDALAEILKMGHATTKAPVNATLCRCSGEGGLFERGRRGTYWVRPEVIAGWAGNTAAA
jgi:hypothetical protein